MPYIGNTVQNQGFTPAIDYFSGNGVTVTFTLSRPLVSVAQIICAIDNVIQNPSSAYTISGNQITFTSAPLSGTNNIWVEYTSLITTYAAISQSPSVIGDITASGGYLAVGSFGNTFIDGTIVDYVTGNGRITTGPADGFTIYNGGTSARNALTTWNATGEVGIGSASPSFTHGPQLYIYNGTEPCIGMSNSTTGATYFPTIRAYEDDFYIDNASTGDMIFRNGSSYAERMRINSSGYVTTPYQPSFSAYATASVASGTVIVFPYTYANVSSSYNTSNGRFTAPIAGTYFFYTTGLSQSNTPTSRIRIRVNGVNKSGEWRMPSTLTQGAGDRYMWGSTQLIYYLNAGDYVDSYYNNDDGSSTLYGDTTPYTTFGGFLVG